jgi:hypothetical protein
MKLGRYQKLLTLITLSIALVNFSYSKEDALNSGASDPTEQALPVAGFQPEQEVLMSKNQEKFEFQVSSSLSYHYMATIYPLTTYSKYENKYRVI